MLKAIKKYAAFCLALSICLCFPARGYKADAAATFFNDDFENGIKSQWQDADSSLCIGGTYYAGRFLTNRLTGIAVPRDCYAEAAVTWFAGYDDDGKAETGFAGIGLHYDEVQKSGYELSVGAAKGDDRLAVRLVKRDNGSETILGLEQSVANVGDRVTLRLSAVGERLIGAIDGRIVFDLTDSDYTSGTAALCTGDSFAKYDDFTLCAAGETAALNGNNAFADTNLSSDGRNVRLANTYEEVLVSKNFDRADDWDGPEKDSNALIMDGRLAFSSEWGKAFSLQVPFSGVRSVRFLSADITLSGERAIAGIVVGDALLSYAIRVEGYDYKTTAQVVEYRPSGNKIVESKTTGNIVLEDTMNLSAVFSGDSISVYLNQELLISYTSADRSVYDYTNKIQLVSLNGTSYYDNLLITGVYPEYSEADFTQADGDYIRPTIYRDDFENESLTNSADYWVTDTGSWFVYGENGGRSYRSSGTGDAKAWLHTLEIDTVFSARVRVQSDSDTSEFGIFTRYAVENSGIRAGYSSQKGGWYIESSAGINFKTEILLNNTFAAPQRGEWITMKLETAGGAVSLSVNGVTAVKGVVYYVGFGRSGLFVRNAVCDFDDVVCCNPSGGAISRGIAEGEVPFDNTYRTYSEVELLPDGGIAMFNSTDKKVVTYDEAESFVPWKEIYTLPRNAAAGEYLSVLRVNAGGYISVSQNSAGDMISAVSDDFRQWTDAGVIVPRDECYNEKGERLAIVHVSSFTEILLSNGSRRIFLPVTFRCYDSGSSIVGHDTRIFYSDDSGASWNESENGTADIGYSGKDGYSFCESKIIKCDDGTLRMYCTRSWSSSVYYAESYDDGINWSRWDIIGGMPCSVSSFGISEDPVNPGTYYMAYVKNIAYSDKSALPRTRLVLVKSLNGKEWKEVITLDRFTGQSVITSSACYQILDPCVLVTENDIYVTYGRSDSYSTASSHNDQRARYVRIARNTLLETDFSLTLVSAEACVQGAAQNEGLRFVSRLYLTDFQTVCYEGKRYTIEGFGTLLVPAGRLADYELDFYNTGIFGGKCIEAYNGGRLYTKTDSYLEYTAMIVNLKDKEQIFAARSYIKLKAEDGTDKVVYGNALYSSFQGCDAFE